MKKIRSYCIPVDFFCNSRLGLDAMDLHNAYAEKGYVTTGFLWMEAMITEVD